MADAAQTDAELIAISRASPESFAILFDRHAVAIHRYVARRMGAAEADDLLGQTFLLAFERRHLAHLVTASPVDQVGRDPVEPGQSARPRHVVPTASRAE
jgi:hypothetical protein